MAGCPSCGSTDKHGSKGGPFSTGRELVEFVYNAHDGSVRDELIEGGGYEATCQGCGALFTLKTFVDKCPECGGVHAIAPVHRSVGHIQFAGKDFVTE
jgi:hypothetical protein